MNKTIFKKNDIRGIFNETLNQATAYKIGLAFALLLRRNKDKKNTVAVGKDVRLSSDILEETLITGLIDGGINVIKLGTCPTPLCYFAIEYLHLDGGIVVTASHNPAQYNGFKILLGKQMIGGAVLFDIIAEIEKDIKLIGNERGNITYYDIFATYKDYILNKFWQIKKHNLKVVVDAGNGTAGLIVPSLLKSMGYRVIELFCEPDGNFPNHHPDPNIVANMTKLIAAVKNTEADIGFAYDGDTDRIGVVDSKGRIIKGDQITTILAKSILKRNPGAKIIGDVKCSQTMFDEISKNGGQSIICQTGHTAIKQKMNTESALLGGEYSGHIFIADDYYGYDDAIYATMRLLQVLFENNQTIDEALTELPTLASMPELHISCQDEQQALSIVTKVMDILKKDLNTDKTEITNVNAIDGVRLTFKQGWGLIRTSNTQPAITIRCEAINDTLKAQYFAVIQDMTRQ